VEHQEDNELVLVLDHSAKSLNLELEHQDMDLVSYPRVKGLDLMEAHLTMDLDKELVR